MSDEFWDEPESQLWLQDCVENLLPRLAASGATVSLLPCRPFADLSPEGTIKYAVEMGLSLILDKPILILANAGDSIPAKLRLVANEIIEVDWDNVDREELTHRINAFAERWSDGQA